MKGRSFPLVEAPSSRAKGILHLAQVCRTKIKGCFSFPLFSESNMAPTPPLYGASGAAPYFLPRHVVHCPTSKDVLIHPDDYANHIRSGSPSDRRPNH